MLHATYNQPEWAYNLHGIAYSGLYEGGGNATPTIRSSASMLNRVRKSAAMLNRARSTAQMTRRDRP